MASISFMSSSSIRMSDSQNYISFSKTFSRDDNTTMTVTLSGIAEVATDNRDELRTSPVTARVSAVSSAVMSSSSHVLPTCPNPRISHEHSVDQDDDLEETFLNVTKDIPEELNAEEFVGAVKIAATEYNKKRALFIEKANATMDYIDEVTSKDVRKITAMADELKRYYKIFFKLDVILKAIEHISEALLEDVNLLVGLAKDEAKEHNRVCATLLEEANAKFKDVSSATLEDVNAILARARELKNNQERVLNLNKQQLSLLGEVSFSEEPTRGKFAREEDEKEPMKSVESIDVAGVKVQIGDRCRRDAITPETPFFKLAETAREQLNGTPQAT